MDSAAVAQDPSVDSFAVAFARVAAAVRLAVEQAVSPAAFVPLR
jgi:hypothetical protein